MRSRLVRGALMALPVPVAPCVLAVTLWAQMHSSKSTAVGDRPAFEVVSVKPNKSIDARSYTTLTRPGGHVAIYDATLRQLIAQAYDLLNLSQATYGISRMPHWGDTEHFDIDAESTDSATTDQKRVMLQSLLADRFHVVVRFESRQAPVYALIMAKPGQVGPQLRPHTDDVACHQQSSGLGTSPPRSPADAAVLALQQFSCGRIVGGVLQQAGPNPQWAGGRKVTMQAIAESLGGDEYLDRPVVDGTGLRGSFDFTMEWNTEQQDLSVNPQLDAQGLSLFEALREQLGLKVESKKGPVRILVIDHVERPSEN
jgi:uncharacterized protein (TIGR03435 family)